MAVDREQAEKVILIIWLIGLIFLWVTYPFLPGEFWFWFYLAIGWSIAGGILALILILTRPK